MENSKEKFYEKFLTQPEDIQDLIMDEDFGPAITLLCSELGISAEKALEIEDEVLNVLIGLSHPKDLVQNLKNKIGVDENKARAIAEKINEEIFKPVEESLKKVHNITEVALVASLASTASQALPPTPPLDSPRSTLNVPRSPMPPAPMGYTANTPQITPGVPRPPAPPSAPHVPSFSPTPEPPHNIEKRPNVFPEVIVPKLSQSSEAPILSTPVPPEPPKPPQNIFEQKLQGVFKMPKEETVVPLKPSHASPPPPPAPPRSSGADPYREPKA